MEKTQHTSDILNKPTEWKNHYLKCEKVKSDLACYSKDLRFLQQLLDRYFDELVKNENLDEMRESIIKFQDLCFDFDSLKKKVKDQQTHLIDIIKVASRHDHDAILKEQSCIENRNLQLGKDFKIVKKEMLLLTEHMLQKVRDNEHFVHRR
ncbi:MAG: hypothetical protein WBM77_08640 [Maribacter sp.]